MATIHLGRLLGASGFARTVAIKRMHPQYAKDDEFSGMFVDEARMAARIQHPNVVAMLDVVLEAGELLLVMDYVHGEPLSRLLRASSRQQREVPAGVAATVMAQALHGLHAAHTAVGSDGRPLDLVHRDVSPQNILVGLDGTTRITDFGIAKALGRSHTTRDGSVRGKLAYMAPEQLAGKVDARTDIFAAGIVLWELLSRERLFASDGEGQTVHNVMHREIPRLTGVPDALADVVARSLQREPAERFQTAREMAMALEATGTSATAVQIGAWVESLEGDSLRQRSEWIRDLEQRVVTATWRTPAPTEEPSHLSAVTSGATPPPTRASGKRPFLVAGAAALLLGGGAAALIQLRQGSTADLEPRPVWTPSASPASGPTLSAPSHEVESPRVAPLIQVHSADPSSKPPSADPVGGSPKPSSTASPPPVRPPNPTATPSARPVAKPQCQPPYTLNADGTKSWKKECF
jgi:eukaryotic-like serine/threonine-protein kinase